MEESNAEYKLKHQPEDFIVTESPPKELQESGDYLVFCMQKKNYTTENAVQQIANVLRIHRKNLGYAGSKDSKAITSQSISIRGANLERVRELKLRDITLNFLGYSSNPISLGDLEYNSFEITVRNIEELPKRKSSIVNYFGEQRFSVNNALVGKAIIQKDFKNACQLVCDASDKDMDVVESYLSEHPTDYVGALKSIPWKILTMYIHAYQSLLWNRCAKAFLDSARDAPSSSEEIFLPLVGFATEFEDPAIEHIYDIIFSEEGIREHDFIIRAIPDLSSSGSTRLLFAKIDELEVGELLEDDANPGKKKCIVRFRLGKGSYATEVVRALM